MSDFSALLDRLLDFEKEHEMVEVLVAVYLIVGFFVSALLWTVLRISQRSSETQTANSEPVKHEALLASKPETMSLHLP